MKIEVNGGQIALEEAVAKPGCCYNLKVIRELDANGRAYRDDRIKNESLLFYRLQRLLKARGHDVVKKNPQKDGHLTSAPYYLRERKGKWCIHDGEYALRDAARAYNHEGRVTLQLYT